MTVPVILEEILKSVELWLKHMKKPQPYVDPNLDPVLLVPGIAGTVLNAVDEYGRSERVWVRIFGADHEFRTKLWSRFDPDTGKTISLDPKTSIVVPDGRYGLDAIDVLDPDLMLNKQIADNFCVAQFIGRDSVYYFHEMIVEMMKWGYLEGTTLFGFGYDFRQSNRLQETMERFAATLESVYSAAGGKKINIISHSMGGLLVKCFMGLHTDIFEKYVNNWIAIAAPFQGAPAYIASTFLNGMSFVSGWEQNFFVSSWSMHQLLIECPSIYELMGCPDFQWNQNPLLKIWRKKVDIDGNFNVVQESYNLKESILIFSEAMSSNTVNYEAADIALPFNSEILKWSNETRKILATAKVPPSVKFYNIYGTDLDTPLTVCYGSEGTPVEDMQQLRFFLPDYVCVSGDGTVPAESAKADGLTAEARIGVPGEHRGILSDRHVFRILQCWLKAGEPDPYYNPLNDYVILPTVFETESHKDKGLQITSVKEEWEIVSQDELTDGKDLSVNSVSISQAGEAQAHATVIVHPQNEEGMHRVELNALSVSVDA